MSAQNTSFDINVVDQMDKESFDALVQKIEARKQKEKNMEYTDGVLHERYLDLMAKLHAVAHAINQDIDGNEDEDTVVEISFVQKYMSLLPDPDIEDMEQKIGRTECLKLCDMLETDLKTMYDDIYCWNKMPECVKCQKSSTNQCLDCWYNDVLECRRCSNKRLPDTCFCVYCDKTGGDRDVSQETVAKDLKDSKKYNFDTR
jgi:hypothetical protein